MQLISIIVPLYNVKDYLGRCVESIRRQTYRNIEILLVDDGSTDGSEIICDELADKDERIRVFHLERGGVVKARKKGVEQAKGLYILFIDSDDWIENEMVEFLAKCATASNADIVTSGLMVEKEYSSTKRVDISDEGIYEKEQKKGLYQYLMYDGRGRYGIMPSFVTKLIRTSLLRDVYTGLCDKIQYGDDAAVVYSSCIRASKIMVTHEVFYHYEQREGSMTHDVDMHFFSGLNEVYLFIQQNIEDNLYKDILKDQLDAYFVDKCLLGINKLFGLNRNRVLIPYYSFSNNVIPVNSRVVLYGAGEVGQDYYIQIKGEGLLQLSGWVDKNYEKYQNRGMNVQSVDKLKTTQFDYIILAFKDQDIVDKIKKVLMKQYDIEQSKIVWFEANSKLDIYFKMLKEQEYFK